MALKENIRVHGKRDIQTKVMTTLFALFAEVERDLISERPTKGAMCTNGTFPRARRGLFMLLAALGFRLRRGCGGARTARTEGGRERPPRSKPRFGRGVAALAEDVGSAVVEYTNVAESELHRRPRARAVTVAASDNQDGFVLTGVSSESRTRTSPLVPRKRGHVVLTNAKGLAKVYARCAVAAAAA